MVNGSKAVREMSQLVLVIVVFALVIGSILGTSTFSSLTIINTSALQATYGAAVIAVTAFLTIAMTLVGVLWFWKYAKPLVSGKGGLGSVSA
jgi:uncharacterized membrane protein YcaP (DUF421 family)